MFLWLIYMGGSFASTKSVRDGYVGLLKLHEGTFGRVAASWDVLLELMKSLIWSERAFAHPVQAFWDDLQNGRENSPIPEK